MEAAIGRRVRRARRARDVTQSQLAVQTGLNVTTISRLENGTAKETYAETIIALARGLGVSADYLLGLSEREEGGVTDTVTDTSPLRLQLQEELRALRAGTAQGTSVSDRSLVLSMLQEEIRTLSASAAALTVHTEGLIAATHTAEQGTGTVALETSRVTDTVTDTESVTDTVAVTGQAREPFDTTRYYLGKLCPHGHDFEGTGHSLLRKHNQRCRECENETKRARYQAKRQQVTAE